MLADVFLFLDCSPSFLDRLENEHLGNMDQYRVTREVPLPYAFDELVRESDKEEHSDEERHYKRRSLRRPRTALPLSDNDVSN
jgi:hypothetical protein